MPGEVRETGAAAELERRIRAHGVRVEQRLALLRTLLDPRAEFEFETRHDALLDAVRAAERRLRDEVLDG